MQLTQKSQAATTKQAAYLCMRSSTRPPGRGGGVSVLLAGRLTVGCL
jgi:hypothetical protein